MVMHKMQSTPHQEKNTLRSRRQVKDYDHLYSLYCYGQDPLDGAFSRFQVQHSVEGLPKHLVDHAAEYKAILPGNCRKYTTPP